MLLRAAAYHESISADALRELFRSPSSQMFADTTATGCANCQAKFAVFFSDRENPNNQDDLADIKKLISQDCNAGEHKLKVLIFA